MTDELPSLSSLIDLKGRLAIITGATAGIGRAIAERLAEAGTNLILISRSIEDLEETKKEFSKYNVDIKTFSVDLSIKDQIDTFWKDISDQNPDILINNAGVYPDKDFLEMSYEEYKKVMDINLNSVYLMCFNFVKKIKDSKLQGNILNIGSLEAVIPVKDDLIHYGVSKAGVVALTRELAANYGRNKVRANVILPGGVITRGAMEGSKEMIKNPLEMLKNTYDFNQRLPLGRIGNPDDIAKMALVMVSDLSSYMTGAVIPVDGGFLSS